MDTIRITKVDIDMVHYEFGKPVYFAIKRLKQRFQVSFFGETPVCIRPLRSPIWQDLFLFHLLPTARLAATTTHPLVKLQVLLLDRQVHPCLLIYAVFVQTRHERDIARLANLSDKSEKK